MAREWVADSVLVQEGGMCQYVAEGVLIQETTMATPPDGGFNAAWVRNSNVLGATMKKNVSGQIIGAQMLSAADGSDFTGAVTAYVLGDGGTLAVGSVGSGACTHKGNGFHVYTPAQAETNYDHVAFTFKAAGAITVVIQIYPSDIQARLPATLVNGRMDSNLSAIDNSTTTLAAFNRAVKTNVIGTVGAGSTPTSIVTSSLTPAGSVADQFKGLLIKFADDTTTAALRGQATTITGSSAAANPTFTCTALTTAPVAGDSFVLF